MAGYVVLIREGAVTDPEEMAKYQASNQGSPPRADMKIHTVYGAMDCVEGEDADGIVILEFPDTAAAKDWYFSDAYQAAAKHRMAAAPYRGFIIEGF